MKYEAERYTIEDIQEQIAQFSADRNWQKFHTVKNLCISISIEAAELMEVVQWRSENEPERLTSDELLQLRQELADIMIYCLSLCNVTGTKPLEIIKDKIEQNRIKYPSDI